MLAVARVTKGERRIARLLVRDTADLELIGARLAARVGAHALRALVSGYRSRHSSVTAIIHSEIVATRPILRKAIVAATLRGIRRARLLRRMRAMKFDLIDEAVDALTDRLKIPVKALDVLEDMADLQAMRVLRNADELIERRLQKVLVKATTRNVHVNEGTAMLRDEFEKLGLTPDNPFQLEAIFRTQTQLAYSAAKRAQETEPDIDQILWGYKYVTVGDDRVRAEHAALEGTTAPKDDAIWNRIYPPNGWACRCSAIPIFEARNIRLPKDEVRILDPATGKPITVTPGPDKGFENNNLFGALRSVVESLRSDAA